MVSSSSAVVVADRAPIFTEEPTPEDQSRSRSFPSYFFMGSR